MRFEGEWQSKGILGRIKSRVKKAIVKIEKSDYVEVLILFLVILLIVICMRITTKKSSKDIAVALIDEKMFLSALIASIITVLAKSLKDSLYNHIEDDIKLELDMDKIKRIYKEEKFEDATTINDRCKHNDEMKYADEGDSIIPIVKCFDFPEEMDIKKDIKIDDNKDDYYEMPYYVKQNFDKLISAHHSSNIYNNLNVRVKDWGFKDNKFVMLTGRTEYLCSMATNRTMDYELDGGLTIRKVLGRGSKLVPLKESRLSNHLGFNGMVESSDGMFPLVFRKKDVSIGKRTYGNSIGASLKTKYALEDGVFWAEGLDNAIRKEIVDELVIEEDSIEKIMILNAYREVVEGGKPQLFFYTKVNMTAMEIQKCFDMYQLKKHGDDEEKMKRDGDSLIWVKSSDIKDKMLFYADHIMCDFYKWEKDRFSVYKKNISMLPSATGCMLFLYNYLERKGKTRR
ncbi:hypothetical protein SAMN02910453_1646 [Lachnospiraceae bacterium A10]|nr:hypothetical protein SAMN02910453_1646 [Lachnospiraceae bacterium A10]